MEQIITGVAAQESSSHPRAAAATVADIMRAPLTTIGQHDHAAAAAYLMKHAGATALMVVNAQTGRPASANPWRRDAAVGDHCGCRLTSLITGGLTLAGSHQDLPAACRDLGLPRGAGMANLLA